MKKLILFFFSLCLSACISLDLNSNVDNRQTPQAGKTIAFAREKGNCLACHVIEDGEFAGNIGPELKNLEQRFKDKQTLREFVWDATRFNPETSMPPFGRNKILTNNELDNLVDYLWTVK